jgi:hypothetical protein
MASPRQRFRCTECGLRFSGRQRADGRIVTYDRAPDNGEPEVLCWCAACAEASAKTAVEIALQLAEKDKAH